MSFKSRCVRYFTNVNRYDTSSTGMAPVDEDTNDSNRHIETMEVNTADDEIKHSIQKRTIPGCRVQVTDALRRNRLLGLEFADAVTCGE